MTTQNRRPVLRCVLSNAAHPEYGQATVPFPIPAQEYPLTEPERAALLEKMDAWCQEQAGMALADFRARYLAEAQQSRQAPGLAQL